MAERTREELIEEVLTRGVVNIIPDRQKLGELLESEQKLNVYWGIDPTSTRIHLGHAVPLRRLQMLVELGHSVTFLIGDFTALIGDTSDKESERPVLTSEQIQENFKSYQEQAQKFLDFSKVKLVHNSEWLNKLDFGEIIKLCRHFSLNDFISRELIKKRLTEGKSVSLPEVLYPVMQGYDSYYLDTDIQVGATDQVFNMQAGRTLQKNLRGKESFIIENAFLPGTDGRKMSKTWGNGIWLDDSPEEVYGKVMSITDGVVPAYFELATSLPMGEAEAILKGDKPMEIKKQLAARIVEEMHGADATKKAAEYFVRTVVEKEAGEDAPEVKLAKPELSMEELIDLIVGQGLAESKSEVRRLLEQGGIYADEKRVEAGEKIEVGTETVVRIGKRKYLKLKS